MNKSQFKDPLTSTCPEGQMDKYKTLDAVISRLSPTGGSFFAAVQSFDANIANISNFALKRKTLTVRFHILNVSIIDNQSIKNERRTGPRFISNSSESNIF